MYVQIEDKNFLELIFNYCKNNLSLSSTIDLTRFKVYLISHGIYFCSFSQITNDLDEFNLILKLDKYNVVKNTSLTIPKCSETIIAFEFGLRGLGPKIIKVFKEGRIEEFEQVYNLNIETRYNKVVQKNVAEHIATIHSIQNMPVEKNNNFLIDKFDIFVQLIEKHRINLSLKQVSDLINGYNNLNNKELQILDLEQEIIFLKTNLKQFEYKDLVFCHNDLHQGNIFIKVNRQFKNSNEQLNLFILNYDLCGYNFRGYDLACYLNSIIFNFQNPISTLDQLLWTTEEELNEFVNCYLNKISELDCGKKKLDLEYFLMEVYFFKMVSSLMSLLLTLTIMLTTKSSEQLDFAVLQKHIYLKDKDFYIKKYLNVL